MRSGIFIRQAALTLALALLAGCGSGTAGDAPPGDAPLTPQESQCQAAGWSIQRLSLPGQTRSLLWKAPAPTAWPRGALLVMHGGGGSYTHFCAANAAIIEPQVRFASQAVAAGFAVFLLDSTDRVTDLEGRLCGKAWDDEVRSRPNLDLPYLAEVVSRTVPGLRPAGSPSHIALVGHSSGGFMAVRAATHLGGAIAAFASVAGGDPYGWYRDCTRRPGDRPNVSGAGFDRETRRQIIEPGACQAAAYPNEAPWDEGGPGPRPVFRAFHHAQDGINDRFCVEKLRLQLRAHGYPEDPPFTLEGGGRSADVHYWLDDYNAPLLGFLAPRTR